MTKYKEYVKKMFDENKELFTEFEDIHFKYSNDDTLQKEFNEKGEKALEVVREYEDRLCRQSEKSGNGVFSGKLAEKFQLEVKKRYPLIDHVGIVVEDFSLNKIKL